MKASIAFYTGILDFSLKYPGQSEEDRVIDLINGDMELQLTTFENDTLFGAVVNILTDDVDVLYRKYQERGLDTSGKENSPVHIGPVDQSWGRREFYTTDADGNTLRFFQPIELPKAFYKNAWPYVEGRRMSLPVKNAAAAAPFYKQIMNLHEVSRTTDPVPTIILERDAIRIAIAENGGDSSQEGCFFEVDNVETALRELQLNGIKKESSAIDMEKHGETSWKVFYIIAPDGLCYCIGQQIPLPG